MIIIEQNHVLNCSMFCILISKDISGFRVLRLAPVYFTSCYFCLAAVVLRHIILLVIRSSLARFSSRSGDRTASS